LFSYLGFVWGRVFFLLHRDGTLAVQRELFFPCGNQRGGFSTFLGGPAIPLPLPVQRRFREGLFPPPSSSREKHCQNGSGFYQCRASLSPFPPPSLASEVRQLHSFSGLRTFSTSDQCSPSPAASLFRGSARGRDAAGRCLSARRLLLPCILFRRAKTVPPFSPSPSPKAKSICSRAVASLFFFAYVFSRCACRKESPVCFFPFCYRGNLKLIHAGHRLASHTPQTVDVRKHYTSCAPSSLSAPPFDC